MKALIRNIGQKTQSFIQQFNTFYKKQSQYIINTKQSTQPQTIKYHKNTYPQLDRFFIRYYNSRPLQGRVSGKSLAFVIGAENIGKTQYIEKNLAEIRKRKTEVGREFTAKELQYDMKQVQFDARKSPEFLQTEIQQNVFDNGYTLVVKKDYAKIGGEMNYINFVQNLHQTIFQQITKLMVEFQQDARRRNLAAKGLTIITKLTPKQPTSPIIAQSLLTSSIIKQIVLASYAKEYIFIYLKDVIYAILQSLDPIILPQHHLLILQQFNQQNITGNKCTCEQFFTKHYDTLIQILWQSMRKERFILQQKTSEQNQKAMVAMKLFYSVFMRVEYENRPQGYERGFYCSGIETTDFLLDVVNFLSGVGRLVEKIEQEYVRAQNENERQEIKLQIQKQNNFILSGNHVDSMLLIMNLQQLMCFTNKSKQFLDFFDHIICRTVSQSNFRHHFPIMIEIPNRQFLDDILQLGKIEGSHPVIIEIPGYIQNFIKYSNLVELLDQKKVMKLFTKFGRNPHTWRQALEHMATGVQMNQIIDGKAMYQQKQFIIAQAKMNRLYSSQRCLPYLNDNTLNYNIRQTLQMFSQINGMGRTLMSFTATVMFRSAYFKSMLEQNIFYHMYYLPYIDYATDLPASLVYYRDEYLKKLKKNHSWLEYQRWKFGQQYTLMKVDVRYKKVHEDLMIENDMWGKDHLDLEFRTTYYGPLKDYTVQYYNRAYSVSNMQ